jgi:hypothetical protein
MSRNCNEMFADGIRLAGLNLLARRHIREGMPLCLAVIEPNRWGSGKRLEPCLESLVLYGTHAKAMLPQLQQLRAQYKSGAEQLAAVDKAIASIQNSKATPTLVGMNEFAAKSSK